MKGKENLTRWSQVFKRAHLLIEALTIKSLKLCQGDNAVLVLNCHGNFMNRIFEIRLIRSLHKIVQQLGKLF